MGLKWEGWGQGWGGELPRKGKGQRWRKEVEGKRCQNLGILWKGRAKAWDVCTWRGVSVMVGDVPFRSVCFCSYDILPGLAALLASLSSSTLAHFWEGFTHLLRNPFASAWNIVTSELQRRFLVVPILGMLASDVGCWHKRGLSSLFRRICFPLCLGSMFDVLCPVLSSS